MKKSILILLLLVIVLPSIPQIFHKNQGVSQSIGSVNKGQLVNGFKFPFKRANFKYFSIIDYYLLGRCYVHSDIYKIVIESYQKLSEEYPDYTFRIMECSKRKGGRPFPHRTHQNGTSIDFMTPLKEGDKTIKRYDNIGVWRYLMKFNEHGQSRINKNIKIDFDKVAKHILVLEIIAKQHGYKIKKVILETNLKDDIYSSKYGIELKQSGIYFVKSLPESINELHDDHYHIDFVRL